MTFIFYPNLCVCFVDLFIIVSKNGLYLNIEKLIFEKYDSIFLKTFEIIVFTHIFILLYFDKNYN